MFAFDKWRAAYFAADEATRAIIRTNTSMYDGLWDALYFLLLIGFAIGNLSFGIALTGAGRGVTRLVGFFFFAACALALTYITGELQWGTLPEPLANTQEKGQSELCATEPDQPAQRAYDCAAGERCDRPSLLFCAHRANDELQLRRWQTAAVTEVLMKRFIEEANRAQAAILPEYRDDYISADNPVRAIEAFVDALDLSRLGFEGVHPEATGRPAYGSRNSRGISSPDNASNGGCFASNLDRASGCAIAAASAAFSS